MMTQDPTQEGPRGLMPRLQRMFLPALLLAPSAFLGPQHVAEGGGARVTGLWRSERALDQYAQEGLKIVQGVLAAARPEYVHGDSAELVLDLGLAESPLDLRWLVKPELKATDQKRRRRRRRAGLDDDDDGGARGQGDVADAAKWGQPLVASQVDSMAGAGPVIAVAPRVHDRVMFGTGLPPATRAALALEAARGLASSEGDLLGPALAGLKAASFARTLEQEPFASSGLAALQRELRELPEGEGRGARLAELAASPFPVDRLFDQYEPTVAPASLVARHAVAMEMDAAAVLALEPEWTLEYGAVGTHPFGWHTVATRRTDALALSVVPMKGEAFTLRTMVVLMSNDLEVPAQADLVLGDEGGDRYHIALNTKEGVYVFHRAGPDAPYETVAEAKELVLPVARPVEVKALWKDHTLVLTVGGSELAGIVLPEDAMVGHYGFGAHAGSTVMFGELELK